ncbi:MAG: hypothetical protein BAJATHORv1_20529 [Candidatus Thorarchaeota archaeon]|nr:MAG: hypothetical protein BAJATHORv1_20529 [Candidatus Thorarchaeota archaeon]
MTAWTLLIHLQQILLLGGQLADLESDREKGFIREHTSSF